MTHAALEGEMGLKAAISILKRGLLLSKKHSLLFIFLPTDPESCVLHTFTDLPTIFNFAKLAVAPLHGGGKHVTYFPPPQYTPQQINCTYTH